jgi:polysaccharide export outer membrane protein
MFPRLAALILLVFTALPSFAANESYQLAAGDVIRISVFGEEDLSFDKVRLSDAGTFAYPFFDQIQARGKTPAQVEKLLTSLLIGDYLINPRVSVSIIEYRDFFVNGEVRSPGGYAYKPGLTLRKAVALAGGLTDRASKSKIYLIRERGGKKVKYRAEMETQINPGDIITVEQSFF